MNKISTTNKYGKKLVGIINQPTTIQDLHPTVILVHGFGVTKEEGGMFDELAERLSKANFIVYRFDFSGCGESEGDFSETSLTKQKEDLEVILDYVKSQSDVDFSRIGILAQSFGTSVTVALEPDVKTIMLMGSVVHCQEIFKEFFNRNYNPTGTSTINRSTGRTTTVNPKFWKAFEKYDLCKSIKNINCPILLLHGKEDPKVPLIESETLYEEANEPKEIIILEGADHGLQPKREDMYKIATSWFKKHL